MLRLAPRDLILGCSISLIWGLNFVVIKVAVAEVPPLTLFGLRFLIVSSFLLMPFVQSIRRRHVMPIVLMGATFGLAHYGFMVLGAVQVDASLAAILIQLGVPFTLVLSAALDSRFPSWNQAGGVLFALAGTALAVGVPQGDQAVGGILLLIASAFAWAVSNRIRMRLTDLSAFSITVWSSSVSAPAFILLGAYAEDLSFGSLISLSMEVGFAVLFLALFASLYAVSVWWRLIARYGAVDILPFFLLGPVLGVAFGVILLGEGMSTGQFIGVGIAVAGIWLIERK